MIPMAMEIVEQPLYDTVDFKRMGQRAGLFEIPIGGTDLSIWRAPQMKDYWLTNMVQPGILPAPQGFVVRDIQVLLFDKDGPLPVFDRTGMGNLWTKSYLRFDVGMKLHWEGPLSLVADPVCLMGGLDALVKMHADFGGLQTALQMLNYQRSHALDCDIRSQEMFHVTVTPYTPVCRQVSVRVVLNGKQMRPTL